MTLLSLAFDIAIFVICVFCTISVILEGQSYLSVACCVALTSALGFMAFRESRIMYLNYKKEGTFLLSFSEEIFDTPHHIILCRDFRRDQFFFAGKTISQVVNELS